MIWNGRLHNKQKYLADVALSTFSDAPPPCDIPSIINIAAKTSFSKLRLLFPAPIFAVGPPEEYKDSPVRAGEYWFHYCEITSHNDFQSHCKKLMHFFQTKEWAGIVDLELSKELNKDKYKLYIIPTSALSQELGLEHGDSGQHLHGLIVWKDTPQEELPVNVMSGTEMSEKMSKEDPAPTSATNTRKYSSAIKIKRRTGLSSSLAPAPGDIGQEASWPSDKVDDSSGIDCMFGKLPSLDTRPSGLGRLSIVARTAVEGRPLKTATASMGESSSQTTVSLIEETPAVAVVPAAATSPTRTSPAPTGHARQSQRRRQRRSSGTSKNGEQPSAGGKQEATHAANNIPSPAPSPKSPSAGFGLSVGDVNGTDISVAEAKPSDSLAEPTSTGDTSVTEASMNSSVLQASVGKYSTRNSDVHQPLAGSYRSLGRLSSRISSDSLKVNVASVKTVKSGLSRLSGRLSQIASSGSLKSGLLEQGHAQDELNALAGKAPPVASHETSEQPLSVEGEKKTNINPIAKVADISSSSKPLLKLSHRACPDAPEQLTQCPVKKAGHAVHGKGAGVGLSSPKRPLKLSRRAVAQQPIHKDPSLSIGQENLSHMNEAGASTKQTSLPPHVSTLQEGSPQQPQVGHHIQTSPQQQAMSLSHPPVPQPESPKWQPQDPKDDLPVPSKEELPKVHLDHITGDDLVSSVTTEGDTSMDFDDADVEAETDMEADLADDGDGNDHDNDGNGDNGLSMYDELDHDSMAVLMVVSGRNPFLPYLLAGLKPNQMSEMMECVTEVLQSFPCGTARSIVDDAVQQKVSATLMLNSGRAAQTVSSALPAMAPRHLQPRQIQHQQQQQQQQQQRQQQHKESSKKASSLPPLPPLVSPASQLASSSPAKSPLHLQATKPGLVSCHTDQGRSLGEISHGSRVTSNYEPTEPVSGGGEVSQALPLAAANDIAKCHTGDSEQSEMAFTAAAAADVVELEPVVPSASSSGAKRAAEESSAEPQQKRRRLIRRVVSRNTTADDSTFCRPREEDMPPERVDPELRPNGDMDPACTRASTSIPTSLFPDNSMSNAAADVAAFDPVLSETPKKAEAVDEAADNLDIVLSSPIFKTKSQVSIASSVGRLSSRAIDSSCDPSMQVCDQKGMESTTEGHVATRVSSGVVVRFSKLSNRLTVSSAASPDAAPLENVCADSAGSDKEKVWLSRSDPPGPLPPLRSCTAIMSPPVTATNAESSDVSYSALPSSRVLPFSLNSRSTVPSSTNAGSASNGSPRPNSDLENSPVVSATVMSHALTSPSQFSLESSSLPSPEAGEQLCPSLLPSDDGQEEVIGSSVCKPGKAACSAVPPPKGLGRLSSRVSALSSRV